MPKQSAWQGSLDMLCGIYSAAHILSLNRKGSQEKLQDQAFRNLLLSAEEKKLFTAKHLTTRGYYDRDLVVIINNLTPRRRHGLHATAFSHESLKSLYNRDRRALIRAGAYAIIQEHGTEHWIAVVRLRGDGGYHCFDPSLEDTTSRRQRVRWDRGVLLSPPDLIGSV